jgi:hypothetical protein
MKIGEIVMKESSKIGKFKYLMLLFRYWYAKHQYNGLSEIGKKLAHFTFCDPDTLWKQWMNKYENN